ncbi:hypothetical protein Taro_009102 [Colocasia esculenta]|uniref:Hexosyltransferase n=1 Tax=Colocasia esculenta TaxID=4460 RepID=A0A843U341_COLES|nr:hypothetical protein [Colocasia esculenta]
MSSVRWVILGTLPIFALSLGCFLVFYLDVDFKSPIAQTLAFMGSTASAFAVPGPVGEPGPKYNFSMFVGVLTRADLYTARHRLRLAYGAQPKTVADIDLRFIFCNLTKEDQRVLVGLEILLYNDIIILNCTENMNDGKTFTYFSSLPKILPRKYDYVMKTDDDTFFRLGPLVESLAAQPREDFYYGFIIPCDRNETFGSGIYMSGMGYVVSWDIVDWISRSNITRDEKIGPEDKMFGWFLDKGKKANHRYNVKPRMYDYPGTNGFPCAREHLVPDTVAVHKLKSQESWVATLSYFNVTRGIKPSKLYHLD